MSEPSVDFQYPDDEAAAPDDLARIAAAFRRITLPLIGYRLNSSEMGTRLAAFGMLTGHPRLRGLSIRQAARQIGVAHKTLARALTSVRVMLGMEKPKCATRTRGNRE